MRPDPRIVEICQCLAGTVQAAALLLLSDDGRELARIGNWDDESTLRAISRFRVGTLGIVVIGWKNLPPLFGIDRAIELASRQLERLPNIAPRHLRAV